MNSNKTKYHVGNIHEFTAVSKQDSIKLRSGLDEDLVIGQNNNIIITDNEVTVTKELDMTDNKIINLADPENPKDAVNLETLEEYITAVKVLPENQIFVGNTSNVATAVSMTGDATIISTGLLTLSNTTVNPTQYSLSCIDVDSKGRVTHAHETTPLNGLQVIDTSVTSTSLGFIQNFEYNFRYLCIGGGGSGGLGSGAGGGSGQLKTGTTTALSVSPMTITVGSGGGTVASLGANGSPSSIISSVGTVVSLGGGYGGIATANAPPSVPDILYGGGGQGAFNGFTSYSFSVNLDGYSGGLSSGDSVNQSAGGGASPVENGYNGSTFNGGLGGNGANGTINNITGSNVYYCAGGGGWGAYLGGTGGVGGGGNGGTFNISPATHALNNTGSGGGGSYGFVGDNGKGGSGIVVIRLNSVYAGQIRITGGTVGVDYTYGNIGDETVITFKTVGTYTFQPFMDSSTLVTIPNTLKVAGPLNVLNDQNSTGLTNGSLVVSGGAAIAKDVYIGRNAKIYSTTESTSTTTGALTVSGGVGVLGSLYINSNANVYSTIASTSTTTGALVVSGGVGIMKDLTIGSNARILSTTASTSTTTGSLIVSGGTGIGGALNIGGNIALGGYIEGGSTNTFIAHQSANQSVSKAIYTTVNQYNVILTNSTLYTLSTGVVTVNRAGTYLISAMFVFPGYAADNGGNGAIIQIIKNGSAVFQNYSDPNVITGVWIDANTVLQLAANDQISIKVWQNSTGTQTLLLATPTVTGLSIVKLL